MAKLHRWRPLRAIIAAATVGLGLSGAALVGGLTQATPAAAQTTTPQHYLCYKASAQEFVVPSGITLINQFAPNGFSPTVGAANLHCNPAEKVVPTATYPITNKTWHFLGFPIEADQPSVTVPVTNQFGTATLVTSSPTELLVPSWKSLTGPPNESTPQPAGEDHYTCYPVKYAPGTTPYEPPKPVQVKDEFSKQLIAVTVGKPKVLCVPTEKILPSGTSFPINDPTLSYVCFKVSTTPIITPVFDQNQFGQGPVTIKKTKWLCLPSTIGTTGAS
jgi:hypothetical protein